MSQTFLCWEASNHGHRLSTVRHSAKCRCITMLLRSCEGKPKSGMAIPSSRHLSPESPAWPGPGLIAWSQTPIPCMETGWKPDVDPSALPYIIEPTAERWLSLGAQIPCRPQPSPDAGCSRSWKFPTGSRRRAGRGAPLALCPTPSEAPSSPD